MQLADTCQDTSAGLLALKVYLVRYGSEDGQAPRFKFRQVQARLVFVNTTTWGSARLAVSLTLHRLFLRGVSLSVSITQPSHSGRSKELAVWK